jgi:hypothetical protein
MREIQEGDLVEFRGSRYWVFEIKGQLAIIVPEDALDFEEQILKLDKASQVAKSRLTLCDVG